MLSGFTTRALILLMGAGAVLLRAEEKTPPAAREAVRVKGFLGVMVTDLHPQARAQMGLPPNEGLFIHMVAPGSPADKAGLKAQDILLQVENHRITSQLRFVALMEKCQPGARTQVLWMHRGTERRAEVTLDRMEVPAAEPPVNADELNAVEWIEKLSNIIRTLRENPHRVEEVDRLLHGSAGLNPHPEKVFRMVCTDPEGSVEICNSDGRKYLRVYDLKDKVLFEGYFNSEAEKAALPEDLRSRVGKAQAACEELTRRRMAKEAKQLPPNEATPPVPGAERAPPKAAAEK